MNCTIILSEQLIKFVNVNPRIPPFSHIFLERLIFVDLRVQGFEEISSGCTRTPLLGRDGGLGFVDYDDGVGLARHIDRLGMVGISPFEQLFNHVFHCPAYFISWSAGIVVLGRLTSGCSTQIPQHPRKHERSADTSPTQHIVACFFLYGRPHSLMPISRSFS